MASSRRLVPIDAQVELLEGRGGAPDAELHGAESHAVVTKVGRGPAALLLAISLVVAGISWQLVRGPETTSLGSERELIDVVARHSPSPTIRWETPPKFGGRGGDYSQVERTTPISVRPGPYR